MINSKEFLKRFNTCSAKFNLIFAYKSAAEISWEDIETNNFAVIRNYSDFCFLDIQRLVISYYPEEQYDWKFFEKKLNALNEFLTLILKRLDERSI